MKMIKMSTEEWAEHKNMSKDELAAKFPEKVIILTDKGKFYLNDGEYSKTSDVSLKEIMGTNPAFTPKDDPDDYKTAAGIPEKNRKGFDWGKFNTVGIIGKIIMIILFIVLGLGAMCGIFFYSIVANAIVLSYMWEWFFVPLGMPEIGVVHAMGISTLVSYLTGDPDKDRIKDDYKKENPWWFFLIYPWLVLAVGWWIHQYM